MTGGGRAADVLHGLAQVGRTFADLTAWLRQQPRVTAATRVSWMSPEERIESDRFVVGSGRGFRFEWYAEATLDDGRQLTMSEELSFHEGEWVIDSSARTQTHHGELVLAELPTRHAIDEDDLLVELDSQTKLLWARRDEVWQQFLDTL